MEVPGGKFSHASSPNVDWHFWSVVKNGTFYIKLLLIPFGQLLEKIGLFFKTTHLVTQDFSLTNFKFMKHKSIKPCIIILELLTDQSVMAKKFFVKYLSQMNKFYVKEFKPWPPWPWRCFIVRTVAAICVSLKIRVKTNWNL